MISSLNISIFEGKELLKDSCNVTIKAKILQFLHVIRDPLEENFEFS